MPVLSALPDLARAFEKAYREVSGKALTTDFITGERFASELLLAARKELGTDVVNWEPESIWLVRDFSSINRDKLLAAKTIATNPAMFIEPRAFNAVSQTLNGFPLQLHDLDPAFPGHMAWAALEGELIYSTANPDSDEPEMSPDVTEFVALALFNEGLVMAPEMLSFADERLERYLSPEGRKLRAGVQQAWEGLSGNVAEHAFPDTAEGVQLAQLAAVFVHCDEQTKRLLSALR